MSFHWKQKKHRLSVLTLAGSGIIGSWWLWRQVAKKQRISVHDRMNETHKNGVFPKWIPGEQDNTQEILPLQENSTPQLASCVLYHTFISGDTRNTCMPNHWHATYWLRFVALIEQEPRRAIVQHTDTKRYHLMMQVTVQRPLLCDDCIPPHEVFRLPVQDHYAYFVFVPQDLDGFALLPHAQEAAQALSIPFDLHRLLFLGEQKESVRELEV